ncbi:MAG: FecR family protein [Candidatus Pseudobacter hemicellulosilyticus]|uniref:FecR family protein n=1 Tax=Candidatus Pseudobacter hemicellulosilyticus TaxID=3121375 RepID=A0AAJ5WTW7_9BACT|nr:MAG: FecR family protein [Pseudobacter sp.]
MESSRIVILLQQYANGQLDAAGQQELSALLAGDTELLEAQLAELVAQTATEGLSPLPDNWQESVQAILAADALPGMTSLPMARSHDREERLVETIEPQPAVSGTATRRRRLLSARYWMAASFLLVLGTAGYIWFGNPQPATDTVVQQPVVVTDALPGTDGAILTLADGSQLVLDSLGNGVLTTQQGAQVLLQNGTLQYDLQADPQAGQQPAPPQLLAFNTMTTPKGRQFRLLLPDGTRVWLNAASAIRYPTRFGAGNREVELTGEAYFEVTKNSRQPFIVKLTGMGEVEVTGTQFNIKAYADETVATTLLEGAVTIRTPSQQQPMQPGSQTTMLPDGKLHHTPHADTEQAVAWKNRSFSFKETDLKTILKQLARWYDIEVKYQGAVPEKTFTSNLSMDTNLSEILTILRSSKINFSFENGVLTVQ